ncbi:MAG: hypothetical protein PQJ46_09645 [Spirochaetales bacterium]|nr:hypothetical protein [Spirochaetales bacterium]
MACVGLNFENQFLWLTLCGLALGGGFSFILAPAKRRHISAFFIFLSIALLFALISFVVSGYSVSELRFRLYWLGASFFIGYLAFLFWKTLGCFLLVAIVLCIGMIYYSFIDWRCLQDSDVITEFTLISETENFIRIEYGNGDEKIQQKVQGKEIKADINFIKVPEYFFILPSEYYYKMKGFVALDFISDNALPSGKLFNFLLKLPGFNYGVSTAENISPNPCVRYIYKFNETGDAVLSRMVGSTTEK